ncbi:putative chaperone/heat shock protein Hsp12 [Patellaria atrata CBS 101060]|uniref:Chaperone/heat shock protein Hsp12 n=1 Tax=Patellaria atrata CBS 101060 TaxID=1346257 RepID=A0A9P4S4V6_9PEZI|nr:putative chaperone/heat shock protein Hsp12 [Patellaria atrata CBS 101060]
MSDTGRKDFSTKAKESMTPDSSKSTTDKISEGFTDTTDKFARGAPDSNKSTTQEIGDKMGRSKDNEVHGGASESLVDKAKNLVGMDKH